jgi:hypothetical protein
MLSALAPEGTTARGATRSDRWRAQRKEQSAARHLDGRQGRCGLGAVGRHSVRQSLHPRGWGGATLEGRARPSSPPPSHRGELPTCGVEDGEDGGGRGDED